MVCGNELLDFLWQVLVLGKAQSVSNMLYYYACTLFGGKCIMRVYTAALVFCEIYRIVQFADVVVQSSGTHLKAVCSQGACRLRSKIANLH